MSSNESQNDSTKVLPKSTQMCSKCRNHKKKNKLKGHKNSCPYAKCYCENCILVEKRRNLMAEQLRTRREQKQDEERATVPAQFENIDFVPSSNSSFNETNRINLQKIIENESNLHASVSSVSDAIPSSSAAGSSQQNQPSSSFKRCYNIKDITEGELDIVIGVLSSFSLIYLK